MKFIEYSVIFLCFISCNFEKRNITKENIFNNQMDSVGRNSLTIEKVYSDTGSLRWHGGGIDLLSFDQKRADFFFNAQCLYSFQTSLEDGLIQLIWRYEVDCTFDRGISTNLDESIDVPMEGDTFATCKLSSDTTLSIDYKYKTWISLLNNQAKDVDTLFPTFFILDKRR